jgi:hypothetical protein
MHIEGLPMDVDGFLPTDAHGRVAGLSDVYAAGDVTTFPIKQGLIATQQADAVAEAIAEDAGARVEPRPFRPKLRGPMLTGDGERYIAPDAEGGLDPEPEWWPPVKIPGKYLAPYLAGLASDGLRAGDAPALHLEHERRGRAERGARDVVEDLHVDLLVRAVHAQARALGVAREGPADAAVAPRLHLRLLDLSLHVRYPPLVKDLPALRSTRSFS